MWIKDVSNGRFELFGNVPNAVTRIASGLTKLGYGKGDVICMFCSNYVEYWLIALAAWSCGGCVMPVNCELDPDHLEEQLNLAKAKVAGMARIRVMTGLADLYFLLFSQILS